jgi:hypothetical protein
MRIRREIQSDDFWSVAFDRSDPFYDGYAAEFRRGVEFGNEEELNWARLALYSITDSALLILVDRLLELAGKRVHADFVESLVFFLSNRQTLDRVLMSLRLSPEITSLDLKQRSESLRAALKSSGATDLATQLAGFESALSNA